jgi:hypothetical protein
MNAPVIRSINEIGITLEPVDPRRPKTGSILRCSAGAGSRYLRAIKRLRAILEQIPGFEAF